MKPRITRCPGKWHSWQPERSASVPVRGFTLIELLVTISIMVILMMIAVPAFNDATLSGRLTSYANELVSSAYLARSEAMKRTDAEVKLCVSANGSSCEASLNWERGWIVLAHYSATNTTAVIHRQTTLQSGFLIAGSVSNISFDPSGVDATTATLTVCRNAPTPGGLEKIVAISGTGQAMVSTTHKGSCP